MTFWTHHYQANKFSQLSGRYHKELVQIFQGVLQINNFPFPADFIPETKSSQ